MRYQEFLSTIKTELSLRVDADVKLDIRSFTKNNGTHHDGLIIFHPNWNISPTIYLMPYYHRYLEGVCLEDIYEDILNTYHKNLPKKDFDTSLFTDYTKAAPHIVMRLVNCKRNENLLKGVPHVRFQDLAILFYCMLYADGHNQANILIHNEHLPIWGITEEELFRTAKKNTPKLLPPQMIAMEQFLQEIKQELPLEQLEELDEKEGETLYILTNRYRSNGATVLLYDGLLQKLAEHFHKDLVIIPSSIHEVLLCPVDTPDVDAIETYNRMVEEVNETELADSDILADHIYYYSFATKKLSY